MDPAASKSSKHRILVLVGVLAVGLALLGVRALRSGALTDPDSAPRTLPKQRAPDDLQQTARALFAAGRYEELDRQTEELFASGKVDSEGDWTLAHVYSALDGPPGGIKAPEGDWVAHLRRLEEWEKRLPASATALALHGEAMVAYAWRVRGSASANSTERDQGAAYRERLDQARALLDRALTLPRPVPLAYAALLSVAIGQGWSREHVEALLERALTLAPTYTDFYRRMAIYLLPRWHGKHGDWQRFAEVSAQRTRPHLGLSLYAQIVQGVASYAGADEAFHPDFLSWSKLREGWLDLEKRCENKRWCREMRGWSACQVGDRSEADEVFRQMGPEALVEVWQSEAGLRQWHGWASQPATDEEVEARLEESLLPVDLGKGHVLNLLQQIRERVPLGFVIDDTVCRRPSGIELERKDLSVDLDVISVGDLLRQVLPTRGLGHVVAGGTVLISTPERLKVARKTVQATGQALGKAVSGAMLAKLNEHDYCLDWHLLELAKVCEKLTKMSGIPIRLADPSLLERKIWLQVENQSFRLVLSLLAFQLDADLTCDGTGVVVVPREAAAPRGK